MNCQEVQRLVEEAIDNRLSEPCKSKVIQHLARCASCKALFAAEKRAHAALFRALNDVSDIPPPATSHSDLAARLVAATPSLTKRAGHVAMPLWLKSAAALAILCGGAALAAWIGGEWSAQTETPVEAPALSPLQNHISADQPKGEEEMKPQMMGAVMSVTMALASPPVHGSSSAEATFDVFSSEFRTSVAAETDVFLSRFRMTADSSALAVFNSTEPQGFIIIIH